MKVYPPLSKSDLADITTLAKRDLTSLKDACIFVTGGTGFIGTWLLERWEWKLLGSKMVFILLVFGRFVGNSEFQEQ
jgi:hypothetical protein